MTARRRGATLVLAVVALVPWTAACGDGGDGDGTAEEPASTVTTSPGECADGPVERLTPVVERRMDHDPAAFTQGFVVVDDTLYESTGLEGGSTLRATDPGTGDVRASAPVPDEVFAEGLAVGADGHLVQLTWREGRAFVWDPEELEVVDEFAYDGEGWGLTALDDGTLAMSDGSDRITVRDPETFEELDRWTVARADGPADQLNELEWDGTHLWANRWRTDEIVRIDPACRRVDAVVDASALTAEARAGGGAVDVLNGIAHVPGTDRYLLTGKRWPVTFEVTFEPDPAAGS